MKIVTKDQAKEFKNSDTCIAYEYALGDEDINGAIIKLSGRYPETGYVTNEACKELVYVISGSGSLVTDKETVELSTGDMALLPPNEKYYFDGTMEMLMPCSPAWYPEQHKEVS